MQRGSDRALAGPMKTYQSTGLFQCDDDGVVLSDQRASQLGKLEHKLIFKLVRDGVLDMLHKGKMAKEKM